MSQSPGILLARPQLILSRRIGMRFLPLLGCAALLAACGGGSSAPAGATGAVKVVAAENFYGDMVQQLGGSHVSVTSIISDPNADPHEYESSTPDAKAIAAAQLVVENGVGYDGFMDKLLSASPNANRTVVNVGTLAGKKEGDNPHLWYNVDWMSQLSDDITAVLQQTDPNDQNDYNTLNAHFKTTLQPIRDQISSIKEKYAGTHLTQTEPVFGYMGDALGLQVDDGTFQHAIEEGTDPSPQDVAQIQNEITTHQVKAVLYNSQTTSPTTETIKSLANQQKVPIVGVSETEPKGQNYQQWMLSQLQNLQKALGG